MNALRVARRCSQGLAQNAAATSRIFGATRGLKITSARAVEDGKQVEVEFEDKSAYRFHTTWMKDMHPNNWGNDYYRKSAKTVHDVDSYIATDAKPAGDGNKLVVEFKNGSTTGTGEEFVSSWLYAFAPYVGRPLNPAEQVAKPAGLTGTGSLLDDMYRNRKPWTAAELDMPRFSAQELRESEDKQIEFLERLVDPGVALITDVGPAPSLKDEDVGKPLESLVSQILGRLNQHPVRQTRYGVMHTHTGPAGPSNADYDHKNPLSMHTDHSPYNGTPGYIQFMYQAQGTVESKMCDGLALTDLFRKMHPEEFELLATVQITHSSRNRIYTKDGKYSAEEAKTNNGQLDPYTFELVHTHPVIELNAEGLLEKIVQSETKRGVCALPYDKYEKFMSAYKLWTEFVENPDYVKKFPWPEHTMVVCNNWRIMHGRATVPPNTHRTMVFGYIQRAIYENRYRLLRQRAAQRRNPEMTDKWTTRMPNQVLSKLVL